MSHPARNQHVHARTETPNLGGPEKVTPDALLKLSGVKSVKALREIAEWKAPREALTPIRELSRIADDGTGWSTGRYAAAIVAPVGGRAPVVMLGGRSASGAVSDQESRPLCVRWAALVVPAAARAWGTEESARRRRSGATWNAQLRILRGEVLVLPGSPCQQANKWEI